MKNLITIFETVKKLNLEGDYITETDRLMSNITREELTNSVPKSSLAYNILFDTQKFSNKQLWVITYEVMKNKEYVNSVVNYDPRTVTQRCKDNERAAKRIITDASNLNIKTQIKEAGKLIKDYYSFLKTGTKELKKEFYSKNYSQESLSEFLSL